MENYFIIHGSFSNPYQNWFRWLHSKLENEGKTVYCPDFPVGVGYQNYENWSKLLKVYLEAGLINENTVFVGHSIAPIFITKFLLENNLKVKKCIFVCGFNDYFFDPNEYDRVNETMFTTDIERIHDLCSEIVCLYSDNDPYVNFKTEKDFADKVSNKQEIIPGGGHLNSEFGFTEFEPIIKYI